MCGPPDLESERAATRESDGPSKSQRYSRSPIEVAKAGPRTVKRPSPVDLQVLWISRPFRVCTSLCGDRCFS